MPKKIQQAKAGLYRKAMDDRPGMMAPNANFFRFFPEVVLPDEVEGSERSSCMHVGAYFVIRKVISEYFLDRMMTKIIGKDAGLFMDLAVYSIMTEGNAEQYYSSYAYNHPLMTEEMKVYSDSKISDFLGKETDD